MRKKIICILICTLFLTITFSLTSAEKLIIGYEKEKDSHNLLFENNPPTDPSITCPDTVKKNRIFLTRASSVDPDGDNIYYRLKVGENSEPSQWIGPRESGVEYVTGMGIFNYVGEIIIGFQAKDEYDAESNWSYHTITFIKSRSRNFYSSIQLFSLLNPILQRLFERNILLNQILFN